MGGALKSGKDKDKLSAVEKYKQLISEIYAEHNKEKLDEIDSIMDKYKGKEKTLYLAVCNKYSIEPKNVKEKAAKKGKGDEDDAEKVAKLGELIREVYKEHN